MPNVKITTETQPNGSTAVAKRQSTAVANPSAIAAGLEGDWSQSDMTAPYLKIVQPTSDIVEALGNEVIGHFLLDDVHDLGKTIEVVPFGLKKQYVEDIGNAEFDPSNPPAVFNSPEEAEEAGAEDIKPYSILDLAIKIPEGCSADAIIKVKDGNWALGRFYARGRTHYKTGCKIYQDVATKEAGCLADYVHTITAITKPVKGRNFRVGFSKVGEATPADLLEKVKELIS